MAPASLEEIVQLVIAEGCVGETIAALEAKEAAAHATDPAVRDALGAISVDESRHAELAYRFVGWTLAQRPELSDLVARCFAQHTRSPRAAALPAPTAAAVSPRLSQHGLLFAAAAGRSPRLRPARRRHPLRSRAPERAIAASR